MSSAREACWAVIPVKAPGKGKTRLAGVLDRDARSRLVAAMLANVLAAARDCPQISRTCLVSASDHGTCGEVTVLPDRPGGLNEALASALRSLPKPGPERVIVVAADLPMLEPQDLTLMADVAPDAIGIAPDRHGTGTNALSLPAAALPYFEFGFGNGSYPAHRAEARRLGYSVETILADGLEKDIDEPGDLQEAKDRLQEAL